MEIRDTYVSAAVYISPSSCAAVDNASRLYKRGEKLQR